MDSGTTGGDRRNDPGAAFGTTDAADWAARAVDTLESVIGAIQSKTSDPLIRIARLLVFGLMALGVGFTMLVLLTIGAVRFIDVYLPGEVWSAHLLLAGIFILIGSLLWSKRKTPPTRSP